MSTTFWRVGINRYDKRMFWRAVLLVGGPMLLTLHAQATALRQSGDLTFLGWFLAIVYCLGVGAGAAVAFLDNTHKEWQDELARLKSLTPPPST